MERKFYYTAFFNTPLKLEQIEDGFALRLCWQAQLRIGLVLTKKKVQKIKNINNHN